MIPIQAAVQDILGGTFSSEFYISINTSWPVLVSDSNSYIICSQLKFNTPLTR